MILLLSNCMLFINVAGAIEAFLLRDNSVEIKALTAAVSYSALHFSTSQLFFS